MEIAAEYSHECNHADSFTRRIVLKSAPGICSEQPIRIAVERAATHLNLVVSDPVGDPRRVSGVSSGHRAGQSTGVERCLHLTGNLIDENVTAGAPRIIECCRRDTPH